MTHVLQFDRYRCNRTRHRWVKRVGGEDVLRFEALIPEVQKSARGSSLEEQDVNSEERRVERARAETDKGALFHEYDLLTHQFIAHIRRIHPKNKEIVLEVAGKGKIAVKAANPLAAEGAPLYYIHGRTDMYNDIFVMLWDKVIGPSFETVCPWMTIDSLSALKRLFDLKFERQALPGFPCSLCLLTFLSLAGRTGQLSRSYLQIHCTSLTSSCGCFPLLPGQTWRMLAKRKKSVRKPETPS